MSLIFGIDFLKRYRIGTNWSTSGKFVLSQGNQILIELERPEITAICDINIPPRALTISNIHIDLKN